MNHPIAGNSSRIPSVFRLLPAASARSLTLAAAVFLSTGTAAGHGIEAEAGNVANPAFDIVAADIARDGDQLRFAIRVVGGAGGTVPEPTGQLANAPVFAYVWPTSLDSAAAGFEPGQGILALAVTAHPDFDDTPLYDENGDGDPANDGAGWHSHWVVLVADDFCGAGHLKVADIAPGQELALPDTWPELPILIDSPGYDPAIGGTDVVISIPVADLGMTEGFNFDAVTAGLRVSQVVSAPLLCVVNVFDVGSGDLSLPGRVD